MSKLHVKQIEGYLTSKLKGLVNMDDMASHPADQVQKAFLTRGLGAIAVSQLAEVALEELGPHVTDGANDGGIDLIYFEPKERTLYLVQSKWHEDGHGSIVKCRRLLQCCVGYDVVLDPQGRALFLQQGLNLSLGGGFPCVVSPAWVRATRTE